MPAPRNFRKILDIDPDSSDFTCVGIKPNGERCGVLKQFIGDEKISRASSLLTEMDTQPLKGSYLYLEELALNTLCPRWHSIAEYSQVAATTQLWTQKIQQLERKEAKAKASVIKETATRRAIAIEEKEASVKERLEEIPSIPQSTQMDSSSAIVEADLVDPFVTSRSAVHASVTETLFTQRLKESRAITSEPSSHHGSLRQSISNKTDVDATSETATTPTRILNLPSPPDTPLVQRQRVSQDIKDDKRRQLVPFTEFDANTPKPAELSQPFKFDYFDGAQFQRSQFEFQFQPATIPNHWPETPKATPRSHLQRREATNLVVPRTSKIMCEDVSNGSDPESKKKSTGDADEMLEGRPAAQSGDLVEASNDNVTTAAALVTPRDEAILVGMAQASPGDELPQTPAQIPADEDYGYVVITSSSRSKAYLPATQRHGLLTPPDEPDTKRTIAAKSNVPVVGSDQHGTPHPAVTQQNSFRISRKPVSPSTSYPSKDLPIQKSDTRPGGSNKAVTEVPVLIQPVSIIDSSPTMTSEGEEVRVGCLGGHHIRHLKEKVVEKVRDMKQRRMWANVKAPIIKDQ